MPEFTFGIPDFAIRPVSRRVRVLFGGSTIADTEDAVLVTEKGKQPVMFLPIDHVQSGLLVPGTKAGETTGRGALSYHSFAINGASAENAAWTMGGTSGDAAQLAGRVAFDPAVVEIEVAEDGVEADGPASDPIRRDEDDVARETEIPAPIGQLPD